MSRAFSPKVVTANDMRSGDVIYLTADDQWSPLHAQAELIENEAHAQLRLLDGQRAKNAVGAYLADARRGTNGPEPVHFREAFRTRGPSNYPHGKQAEQTHV
ncbi:DUF2849 domain-containing protein [Pseudorhodobacter ferrugineus]|uniref:DUF2849 domain-containing protein n=1 Tax=Pseudorhodobacter ferrugineus TaxID=77008 RepID=UPI0003B600B6|nr:DUF2849 domain-containing protein [Pseudorhodobacter ferrugineus]